MEFRTRQSVSEIDFDCLEWKIGGPIPRQYREWLMANGAQAGEPISVPIVGGTVTVRFLTPNEIAAAFEKGASNERIAIGMGIHGALHLVVRGSDRGSIHWADIGANGLEVYLAADWSEYLTQWEQRRTDNRQPHTQ